MNKKFLNLIALIAISLSLVQCEQNNPKEEDKFVDLGLSVKWATCNIGANSPEEYGNYFAWGEVEPKEQYSETQYKHGTTITIFTKYCTNAKYGLEGFVDNKTTLDPEDDAATVILGEKWRMPTVEEQQELVEKCTWTKHTIDSIAGYLITGPNGNSIFLPLTGYKTYKTLNKKDLAAKYWSSSIVPDYSPSAHTLTLSAEKESLTVANEIRYFGNPIRPVCE